MTRKMLGFQADGVSMVDESPALAAHAAWPAGRVYRLLRDDDFIADVRAYMRLEAQPEPQQLELL